VQHDKDVFVMPPPLLLRRMHAAWGADAQPGMDLPHPPTTWSVNDHSLLCSMAGIQSAIYAVDHIGMQVQASMYTLG
jgi:hypothetical protein